MMYSKRLEAYMNLKNILKA